MTSPPAQHDAATNTDRLLWRGPSDWKGEYYADSVSVTEGGGIAIQHGGTVVVRTPEAWVQLAPPVSPPANHNPPDNGACREDADDHPPLGQIPQRHSDLIEATARAAAVRWWRRSLPTGQDGLTAVIADALRAVDRAAREECARIAEGSAGPFPKGKRIEADGSEARELAIAMQFGLGGGRDAIAAAIRQTIKP